MLNHEAHEAHEAHEGWKMASICETFVRCVPFVVQQRRVLGCPTHTLIASRQVMSRASGRDRPAIAQAAQPFDDIALPRSAMAPAAIRRAASASSAGVAPSGTVAPDPVSAWGRKTCI